MARTTIPVIECAKCTITCIELFPFVTMAKVVNVEIIDQGVYDVEILIDKPHGKSREWLVDGSSFSGKLI